MRITKRMTGSQIYRRMQLVRLVSYLAAAIKAATMALENKLGTTSSAEFAREEERISKKKAIELLENGLLDKMDICKFSSLCAIYKYLFEDIYDFTGQICTVNSDALL